MRKWLNTSIDNSGLILFRILFGVLIMFESFGALLLGWVNTVFIQTKFTFHFIGFDFLELLHGIKMYYYFVAMGVLGLLIALGFFYRWVIIGFTILWTLVYFAQKEFYNNHYYFVVLIAFIMCFLPANKRWSLDVHFFPKICTTQVPRWMPFLLIFQVGILYFYASLAKIYPDWLNGTFASILLSGYSASSFWLELINQKWFVLAYSYLGLFYDLFIIPALLWKRTRIFAILASLFFHLSNALFLKIGIFPFFALSFIVLFLDYQNMNYSLFKTSEVRKMALTNSFTNLYKLIFIPFFIFQFLLPIRHFFIKGNVLFTEEGHRLSWRMMLSERRGKLRIKVLNKQTKEMFYHNILADLNAKQINIVSHSPDMIWQYCQKIKEQYIFPIEIYVESFVSVNRRPYYRLIDQKVNMAEAKFDYFFHNEWILLQELN